MEWNQFNLNNLFSLYREIERTYPGTSIHNFNDYYVVRTSGAKWPNIAYGMKQEYITEETIHSIDREMSDLNMHPYLIAEYTSANYEKLTKFRFRPAERWQGMYLDNLGELMAPERDGRLAFVFPEGKEIELWTNLVSDALFNTKYLHYEIFRLLKENGTLLVGLKIKNELVGTGMVYCDEAGIAGIYMIAVKEQYRGMGLGRMLVNFCLEQIRERKNNKCILQSTKAATSLYDSLNFKRCGTYLLYWKM